MKRRWDPLQTGFYCVDYILDGEEKTAVYFQLESAQQALITMMRKGIECNGMREWQPNG